MPTETSAAHAPSTSGATTATLNSIFTENAARWGDKVALKRKLSPGRWEEISWRAYREISRKVGLGLIALGLAPGERVGILSNSRVEWVYADMGTLGAGGVAV